MSDKQTRRDFLKSTSKKAIGLGIAAQSLTAASSAYSAQEKSQIAIVRN